MRRRRRHFRAPPGPLAAGAEPAPTEHNAAPAPTGAITEGGAHAAFSSAEPPHDSAAPTESAGPLATQVLAPSESEKGDIPPSEPAPEPPHDGELPASEAAASQTDAPPEDKPQAGVPPPSVFSQLEAASAAPDAPAEGAPMPESPAITIQQELPPDDASPRRDFPVPARREKRFQVVILRSVLNDLHAHAGETFDGEIGGVLLGNVCQDDSGEFLHIRASVRGVSRPSHSSQVKFDSDDWTKWTDEQEQHHPEKKMVGWYHSHPGHGIFLSDMDLFIHRHFFSLPWQVALVYDPQSREDGIFVWKDGQTVRDELLVEDDAPADEASDAAKPAGSPREDREAPAPPMSVEELAARVEVLEQRQKTFMAVIVMLAAAIIAWPLILSVWTDKTDERLAPPATQNVEDASRGPLTRPAGALAPAGVSVVPTSMPATR